ncbi:hypothetical protein [Mobilicoccus sp.]|uniref:hypothetical protein n=1 Tax=Mobilicoccus sp. TaxID=2034349 RepID=UPI0028B15BC4|nr:hypothetical protein [Mobilicoccus sp.]
MLADALGVLLAQCAELGLDGPVDLETGHVLGDLQLDARRDVAAVDPARTGTPSLALVTVTPWAVAMPAAVVPASVTSGVSPGSPTVIGPDAPAIVPSIIPAVVSPSTAARSTTSLITVASIIPAPRAPVVTTGAPATIVPPPTRGSGAFPPRSRHVPVLARAAAVVAWREGPAVTVVVPPTLAEPTARASGTSTTVVPAGVTPTSLTAAVVGPPGSTPTVVTS